MVPAYCTARSEFSEPSTATRIFMAKFSQTDHQIILSLARRRPRARLFLGTARVCCLEFGDLLIVERHGRAAVSLFADEVELGRRLMAAHAWHALEIGRLVPTGSDLGALRRDIQREKFPAVGVGKFLARVLDHYLTRKELQERADRVFPVRHTVLKYAHRLLQFLRVRVLDVRISDFAR